jgi:hypothetical protein
MSIASVHHIAPGVKLMMAAPKFVLMGKLTFSEWDNIMFLTQLHVNYSLCLKITENSPIA